MIRTKMKTFKIEMDEKVFKRLKNHLFWGLVDDDEIAKITDEDTIKELFNVEGRDGDDNLDIRNEVKIRVKLEPNW